MEQKQTEFIAAMNRTIRRYKMLTAGDTVLVAVSGGPDSVALLHALIAIQAQWSLRLVVAHFNHGLRPGEAQKDAEFVRQLAASLNLACEVGFQDVKRFSNEKGFSIQEGAREARYLFLREAGARCGAGKIALGHHADDNAESVLINLFRGTGPRGLAGIPPVRENFIRPLIEMSHDSILDYLGQKNLSYTTDRSNWDPKYLRNRVRHELLPLLKERSYMNSVSGLNRLASIMRAEEDFWEPIVEKALQ